MKKTMKRYLSFLLAIMMLVTSVAFSVTAAECKHVVTESVEVYPTCVDQGYMQRVCTNCKKVIDTYDYKNSYGHMWSEERYEPILADYTDYKEETFDHEAHIANGGAYRKYQLCTRKNCDAKSIETEDEKTVAYYVVRFYNNKVTDEYDKSITYTDVADTYKEVLLYSEFVKEGTRAVYAGKYLPTRDKTKAFPTYTFIGWTEDAELREATTDDNLSTYKCADLSAINENKNYYPVFVGETNNSEGKITYNATIYIVNEQGGVVPGTVTQKIAHGESPKYKNPDGEFYAEPTKPEDIVNTYTFNGWSTDYNDNSGISGIFTESYEREDGTVVPGIEETPVYGNVGFYPTFIANPKSYTLEFRSYDQKTILEYSHEKVDASGNGQIIKEKSVFYDVNLNTNLLDERNGHEGIIMLNNDADATDRVSDDTYYYIWTGKWAVVNKDGTTGRTVDLRLFNIYQNEYTAETDENGNEINRIIRLVPVYERYRKVYDVKIKMQIPEKEDDEYYLGEADVHVVDKNGQLVASGKTDAYGEFNCYLYDQRPFTVTVATQDEKYLGTAQIHYLTEGVINNCIVSMEENPDYETHCTCIHHNALLQPIWVRILNILYSLFNVKYVCCYDMYSTIGSLLAYTA